MCQLLKLLVRVCHLNHGYHEQRLDAETLTIVADEFGYEVEFITVDIEAIQVVEDREEDLVLERLLLL
jgi:hypothetical protein